MLKVLLWSISNDNRFIQNAVTILKCQHGGIEIVGTVKGKDIIKASWGGGYDILLVIGARNFGMSQLTNAARKLNLPEEKLLGDWIVCIPGFTLEKYRHLQSSRLSIISVNCFGGCLTRLFGLPIALHSLICI